MSEPNVHEQLAGMTIERDAALAAIKILKRRLRIANDTEIVLRAEVRHHVASSEAFEEQVIRADKAETALRDMEIERNMLRHALEGVLAKAEGRRE